MLTVSHLGMKFLICFSHNMVLRQDSAGLDINCSVCMRASCSFPNRV